MAAHQAPRPWDSPGRNTGVGCHFLLQCMKVKSESEVAQLCLTPSDPMDCSLPGSSIHGDSPGKNTGVGCHALLQGIFATQKSNPGILHCRRIVYHLSNQESPFCAYETLNNKNSMVGCAPKLSIFVQEGEK